MKTLFTFLFVLFIINLFGQIDTNRYSLGLSVGLNDSFSKTKNIADNNAFVESLDSLEQSGWYGQVGLHLGIQLNAKLQLSGGLEFDTFGHTIDTISNASLHSIRYSYRYLGLPIGIVYQHRTSHSIVPFVGAALVPSKLISQQWAYRTYSSNSREIDKTAYELNTLQLQARINAGILINMHPKYTLSTSIGYQRNLISLSNFGIERFYQKFGIQMRLDRSF